MGNVGALFETVRGMQHCRARLVLVTCDLPARAMLLCIKMLMALLRVAIVTILE